MSEVRLTRPQREALMYIGPRRVSLKELRLNGFNLRVINGLTAKGLAYWSNDGESCSLNDAGIRIYREDN